MQALRGADRVEACSGGAGMTYTGSPTTVMVEMWRDGIGDEDPRIRVDQSFALAVIC